MPSQDDFIRTALRVPPELHKRLHDAAQRSGRTFNSEILTRLAASFDPMDADAVKRDDIIKIVDELITIRLERLEAAGLNVPPVLKKGK